MIRSYGSDSDGARFAEPQAARILKISTRTLQRYRQQGLIGHHRSPGGRIHYTLDQLTAFTASLRVDPAEGATSRRLSS